MKKILLVGMVLAACGRGESTSETDTSLHPDTFKTKILSVTPKTGALVGAEQVKIGGAETIVKVSFHVDCDILAPISTRAV